MSCRSRAWLEVPLDIVARDSGAASSSNRQTRFTQIARARARVCLCVMGIRAPREIALLSTVILVASGCF